MDAPYDAAILVYHTVGGFYANRSPYNTKGSARHGGSRLKLATGALASNATTSGTARVGTNHEYSSILSLYRTVQVLYCYASKFNKAQSL